MKLLAIIVNYKTADMTLRCVDSLMTELRHIPRSRAVVVDNDSRDGSFERIEQGVRARPDADRIDVVASPRNGGFAFGVNFGVKPALASSDPPDYVYLLNSDAFPDPEAVQKLVDFLDAHPEVGIAGSYIHGVDGRPHETAFRFPTLLSEVEAQLGFGPVSRLLRRWVVAPPIPTETVQVDWLAGASMLIRRSVFERVGLFDDTYFLYYEETDFCRRARLAGFTTWYVRDSSVAHIGSVSTGYQDISKPTPKYWYASRRHYFEKNHGKGYTAATNVGYVVCGALRRARWRIQDKPEFQPKGHLRDFVKFNFSRRRAQG